MIRNLITCLVGTNFLWSRKWFKNKYLRRNILDWETKGSITTNKNWKSRQKENSIPDMLNNCYKDLKKR